MSEPLARSHPLWNGHRAFSALLALVYAVYAIGAFDSVDDVTFGGVMAAAELLSLVGLPLACIWFPEFIAKQPFFHYCMGTSFSPGWVRAGGWAGMCLPLVVALLFMLIG